MQLNSSYTETEKRIELKEVYKTRDRFLLDRALALSRFSFIRTYPNRIVNSVYFDTFDFKNLEDSLEGGSIRRKTRIRWYGEQKDETSATLEIKLKRGHLSWKKFCKDAYTIKPRSRDWKMFLSRNLDKSATRFHIDHLFPKSIVSYHRSYFASCDGRIRITIDQKLKTFMQHSHFHRNLEHARQHSEIIVWEVKIAENDQPLLKELLKDLPFSPQRFSKYCESVIPQKSISF